MLQIGRKQNLQVIKKVDFGIYLAEFSDAGPEERVLLPAKQVPAGIKPGDRLEVFLYKDSSDRIIATTREPKILLGETAVLKVRETGKIGAFLDWGLEKDLLLPFREQTGRVKTGDEVLVAMYLDKSSRLCATMNVYHYLKQHSPYRIGDEVKGRVYETSGNFGVFIAVEDTYSARIPLQEAQGTYQAGEILTLRVTGVLEDGRLTVTPRQKAYLQLHQDAEAVEEIIRDLGGVLPFDDKASPEQIKETFGLSKAAFKRAVGHLLKEKHVKISGGKITLI